MMGDNCTKMRYFRPHLDIGVILELNGTFGRKWVLYDLSLVALHTISNHLWVMAGDSV